MSGSNRVLIVEDDLEIRETLVEILSDDGFETVGVSDGLEALEQLRDPGDRWAVVVLDLMMPNLDGWGFRAQQLADPAISDIPVVVLSAIDNLDEVAAELGVEAHFTKPVPMQALLAAVSRYCPRS